jgi:hypothetical protein
VGSNYGVLNVSDVASNPGLLPLPSVAAQSDGTIHDTPMQGVTAVVVQSSPATHGNNLTTSKGNRNYCIPYADFASGAPFQMLGAQLREPEPYLQTQAAIVGFFTGGFQGKSGVPGVPGVVVTKAPVRSVSDPPRCGG